MNHYMRNVKHTRYLMTVFSIILLEKKRFNCRFELRLKEELARQIKLTRLPHISRLKQLQTTSIISRLPHIFIMVVKQALQT